MPHAKAVTITTPGGTYRYDDVTRLEFSGGFAIIYVKDGLFAFAESNVVNITASF